MTDYYVDSVGGDGTDGLTWAKAKISVAAVLAVPPVAGDRIFVLNTEAADAGATTTWPIPSASEGNPVLVISTADTANMPPLTYASGARQGSTYLSATNADDFTVQAVNGEGVACLGMTLISEDNFDGAGTDGTGSYFECVIHLLDVLTVNFRSTTSYTKCEFLFLDTAHTLATTNRGSPLIFRDCSLHASCAAITRLFNQVSASDSGRIEIDGFDFTGAEATGSFELISVSDIHSLNLKGSGIKLPTNGTICDATTLDPGACIDLRCVSSTSSGIAGVFYKTHAGTVTEDTTTYLDATYDGTNGYSLCFTPTAAAIKGLGDPTFTLRYDICEVWCDANPTITVHMTSDTGSMGNQSIWLEIEHPDATSAVLRTITSTLNAHKMLGTDAALTDDSAAAWTSGKTNDYSIASTLSSSAGVVKVFVCVANSTASVPVLYVDPAVDIT